MQPIRVGVLSTKLTKLAQEIKFRLPSASVSNVMPSEKSGKLEKSSFNGLDVIVADYDLVGPHLYCLENMKFIQGTWAGIDALLPHVKANEHINFPIIRFSGQHFGRMITEYVIASIVNHERDVLKMYENQQKCSWELGGKVFNFRTIYDLTIGVMGIGQIGSRVLTTLKCLGAKTIALGRRDAISKNEFPDIDEYYSTPEIGKFLSKCDYIINTLPTTNETRGMLNSPVLEACKEKHPIFINVGRGPIISDECLLKALDDKLLSHAYLDVFNEEPLPENHALWKSDKVKISPHVAAPCRAEDVAEQFVENLKLFEKNEAIPWEINFARGY